MLWMKFSRVLLTEKNRDFRRNKTIHTEALGLATAVSNGNMHIAMCMLNYTTNPPEH